MIRARILAAVTASAVAVGSLTPAPALNRNAGSVRGPGTRLAIVKGTVEAASELQALGTLRAVGVNANRGAFVAGTEPNARSRYQLPLTPGLYLIGLRGSPLPLTARYTHAIRLRSGDRLRVSLPPKVSWRMPVASDDRVAAPLDGGRAVPVVDVGAIQPSGFEGVSDGLTAKALTGLLVTDLTTLLPEDCVSWFTDAEARRIARKEVDFQRKHPELFDPSTRVRPRFVKPTQRVTGFATASGDTVTITLQRTDIGSGNPLGSQTVTGPLGSFFDLMNAAALATLLDLCDEDPPVPAGWTGTANGTLRFQDPVQDLTETWNATYTLRRDETVEGIFYGIDQGTMIWSVSGTIGDCQASAGPITMALGEGPPEGFGHVWIDPARGEYMHGLSSAQPTVVGTVTCPDASAPFYRVPSGGGFSYSQPWEPGMNTLSGSVTEGDGETGILSTWSWTLTALE